MCHHGAAPLPCVVGPTFAGHVLPRTQDPPAWCGALGLLHLWNRSHSAARQGIAASHCPGPRKQGLHWAAAAALWVPSANGWYLSKAMTWTSICSCHQPCHMTTWPWLTSHVAMGHFHRVECNCRSRARALTCSWSAQRNLGRGFISAEHPTYRSNRCSKHWQSPKKWLSEPLCKVWRL